MLGNSRSGMVIQPRDKHLLRELEVMRIIDREQAKVVAGFRSTTRANARLLALYKEGLLRRFFQGTTAGGKKAFYTLLPKGARLVGTTHRGFRHGNDELLTANFFVAHQSAVNDVYCLAKYPSIPVPGTSFVRWMSFAEPLVQGISLIPDGYVEVTNLTGLTAAFLEVDLGHEGKTVWKGKVRSYLRYATSGAFKEQFGQSRFRVLVIANTERRMHAIRSIVSNFTDKVFWFSTLDAIRTNGLLGPVWLRPVSESQRSYF